MHLFYGIVNLCIASVYASIEYIYICLCIYIYIYIYIHMYSRYIICVPYTQNPKPFNSNYNPLKPSRNI